MIVNLNILNQGNDEMKSQKKSLYSLLLGVFVISILITCQSAQSKQQKQPVSKQTSTITVKTDTGKAPESKNKKIIVCYFHGNIRCPACIDLENFTKSEVETSFADAIRNGKMEWRVVNYDVKGNEHFMDDYKLYAQSVVILTINDGKETSWKNLNRVWQLVQNESNFREYIRGEVAACLAGKCL